MTPSARRVVIKPVSGWVWLNLRELWEFRDLGYFLVWRDMKVKYKQTALGVSWALLQPTLTCLVFTVFFAGLLSNTTGGVPYPLFALAALLPWTFVAHGVAEAASSLVGSANVIKKVYFPRLLIPMAAVAGGMVEFALAFVVLAAAMFWYGISLRFSWLVLPLFVTAAAVAALGLGIWLSALNAAYRDFRYVIPFFLQLWLFVTPVIYSGSTVTARLEKFGVPTWLYGLNPMAGVVDGFRWALFGGQSMDWQMFAVSVGTSMFLLVSGTLYFRRVESTLADVI